MGVKFLRKYPFIYLFLTPLIFVLITPLTSIPSAIISAIFFGYLCEGKGELCMLGPGFATLIVINIICSYIIGLILYKIVNKPTNKQFAKTAILLFLFFVFVFGSLFVYESTSSSIRKNEKRSVYEYEQSIEYSDLTIVGRNAFENSNDWLSYDTTVGVILYYPESFILKDHAAPSSFYLRTNDTSYEADKVITNNNNRFINIGKIRFIPLQDQITDEKKILADLLEIVHSNYKDEDHPEVLKKTVDFVDRKDGNNFYYLEQGEYDEKKIYNKMYVAVVVPGKGYYLLETYTTFYEGNEIAKRIIENSEYY